MVIYSGLPAYYGTDTSDADAKSSDLLQGKSAYVNEEKIIGQIPSKTAETYIPKDVDQIIESGVYLQEDQTIKGDSNLLSKNIKAGTTIFGVAGDSKVVDTTLAEGEAAATSNYMAKGRVSWADGKKSVGNATIMKSNTYTISSEDQTITGPVLIEKERVITFKGEPNLIAENVKAGVTIGTVTGSYSGGEPFDFSEATIEPSYVLATYKGFDKNGDLITGTFVPLDTSDATATSLDIKEGVTAYVNGEKITGNAYTRQPLVAVVDGKEHYLKEGFYGGITIPAEPNLTAENIKKGVTIYGTTGEYEGSGGTTETISFDTTEATSIEEVFEILHEGAYTYAATDGENYKTLPGTYTYHQLCCTYDAEGGLRIGGINLNTGSNGSSIFFALPVDIDSPHILLYYLCLVSSWVNPSFTLNLYPIEAVEFIKSDTPSEDGTYAVEVNVDLDQLAFSRNCSMPNIMNGQRIFTEIKSAPVGKFYAQILLPQQTGGNVVTLGQLGYFQL